MMAGLKPSEELVAGSFAITAVLAIFSNNASNYADVKVSKPGNANIHSGIKTAAITSAAVVSGIALLAKSPTVFVLGGVMTAIEAWKLYYANAYNPATGKVTTAQQTQ